MSEEFLAFPLPGGRWSRRDRMRVSIVGAVVIEGRTQRSAPTRAIVTCHPIDNGCTSVVPFIRLSDTFNSPLEKPPIPW